MPGQEPAQWRSPVQKLAGSPDEPRPRRDRDTEKDLATTTVKSVKARPELYQKRKNPECLATEKHKENHRGQRRQLLNTEYTAPRKRLHHVIRLTF